MDGQVDDDYEDGNRPITIIPPGAFCSGELIKGRNFHEGIFVNFQQLKTLQLGSAVPSIVSLTSLLRGQLVQ